MYNQVAIKKISPEFCKYETRQTIKKVKKKNIQWKEKKL